MIHRLINPLCHHCGRGYTLIHTFQQLHTCTLRLKTTSSQLQNPYCDNNITLPMTEAWQNLFPTCLLQHTQMYRLHIRNLRSVAKQVCFKTVTLAVGYGGWANPGNCFIKHKNMILLLTTYNCSCHQYGCINCKNSEHSIKHHFH